MKKKTLRKALSEIHQFCACHSSCRGCPMRKPFGCRLTYYPCRMDKDDIKDIVRILKGGANK